jgi:hypothetical protein
MKSLLLRDGERVTFSQEPRFLTELKSSGLVVNSYDQRLKIAEFKQLACNDVTEMQFALKSFRFTLRDVKVLRGVLSLNRQPL